MYVCTYVHIQAEIYTRVKNLTLIDCPATISLRLKILPGVAF